MGDWFRQPNWNEDIEEYFFKKLARARKETRAQYLKIQAIELIETKNPSVLYAAETLLQKLLNDYPENKIDRSQSFASLGDISRLRSEFDVSFDWYLKAIEHEEIYPNVKTSAYLYFAELVIKLEKQEFYLVSQSLILNRIKDSPFPIEKYKAYSFLSIISFRMGNYAEAIKSSSLAEESASIKTSTLRYHEGLGLVVEREKWIDELIAYHRNKRNESAM